MATPRAATQLAMESAGSRAPAPVGAGMQGAALCEAIIPYWDGKSKPMSYQLQSMVPEGGQQTVTMQHKRCKMYDMRALRSTSLDVHGFLLVDHATTLARGDFLDAASLTGSYYAEMEQLIRAHVPGVERVVVFDHNVRTAGENLFDDAAREEQRYRDEAAERVVPIGPVIGAHNDYTHRSGPLRVKALTQGGGGSLSSTPLLTPSEAEEYVSSRHFAIVQVWRPIHLPVQDCPLAVCDAATMSPGDLQEHTVVYPDREGFTYVVAPNDAHRWYYPDQMTRDEALIFKVFDSADDGRARFTAHSAVQIPGQAPGTPRRESCEVRALVVFDTQHPKL